LTNLFKLPFSENIKEKEEDCFYKSLKNYYGDIKEIIQNLEN